MSRARFQDQENWQTAVASENGSGCLSFYVLPPLAALLIVGLVALIALKSPLSPAALPINNSTLVLQNSAPPIGSVISPAEAPAVVTQSLVSPTQAPGVVTPIWSFSSENTTTSSSGLSPIFSKEV